MISHPDSGTIRIALCGDVMTGRGIDQILIDPCAPGLHESVVSSAERYVQLAEQKNGRIPRRAPPEYVWGAALAEFQRNRADLRIVNLETSITRSDDWSSKGINYRMSPENADCLSAANIDCCVLANNHILDWGAAGLLDTLDRLKSLGIRWAGAGRNLDEAQSPVIMEIANKGRVIVHAAASHTAGAPESWAAKPDGPGVRLFSEDSDAPSDIVAKSVERRAGDIAVVSLHWGSNWGYQVTNAQRRLANALIREAGVSVVHGHSSHHPRGIEIVDGCLIIYGCGDFLNDYEGIPGYEEFRSDLALLYFADIETAQGKVVSLEIVPFRICGFQLMRPGADDVRWLKTLLTWEYDKFGAGVILNDDGHFSVVW